MTASTESKPKKGPKKKKPERSKGSPSPGHKNSQKAESPATAADTENKGLRLNVYLQRHGVASRRKADEMISAGAIRINRKVVTTLGSRVQPDDKVSVNGRVLKSETPKLTYLFNKPDLYLTTRKDSRSRNTIFDIPALKKLPNNVQAVGRLDFRSEGLLILTNDGDLAYALAHPKFHVEKTYAILVSEIFSPDDLERLRNGVSLADGYAKPVSVKLGGSEKLGGSRGQWLKIVVIEGRNRLVRRMLASIGFKVVRLVRIGVGLIQLPENLKTGEIQPASRAILDQLEKYKSRWAADAPGKELASRKPPTDSKKTNKGAQPGQKAKGDRKRAHSQAPKKAETALPKSKGRKATGVNASSGKSRPKRAPTKKGKVAPEVTEAKNPYEQKKVAESLELARQKENRKKRTKKGS